MPRQSIRLPDAVTLPAGPETTSAAVTALLGASRATIYNWRRDHQFPRFLRRGQYAPVSTSELAAWLEGRGVTVVRLPPEPPAPPPMPWPHDFERRGVRA